MRVAPCFLLLLVLGCNLTDLTPPTDGPPTCDPECPVGSECGLDELDQAACFCIDGHGGEDCSTCLQGFAKTAEGLCVADPCNERSCLGPNQLSGTCEPLATGDFKCACAPGFGGDKCDQAEGGCALDPCQNGGTCSTDDQGQTSCACVGGFTGDTCETCPEGFNDTCTACLPGRFGADCSLSCDATLGVEFARGDAVSRTPIFITNTTNEDYGRATSEAQPGVTVEFALPEGFALGTLDFYDDNGAKVPHTFVTPGAAGEMTRALLRLPAPLPKKSTATVFMYIGGNAMPNLVSDVINGTGGWAVDENNLSLVAPPIEERFLSVQIRQISPNQVRVLVLDNSDDPQALGSLRIDDKENDLPREVIKQYANLAMGSSAEAFRIEEDFTIIDDSFQVTLAARESTRIGIIFGDDIFTMGDPEGIVMRTRSYNRTPAIPAASQVTLCPGQDKP